METTEELKPVSDLPDRTLRQCVICQNYAFPCYFEPEVPDICDSCLVEQLLAKDPAFQYGVNFWVRLCLGGYQEDAETLKRDFQAAKLRYRDERQKRQEVAKKDLDGMVCRGMAVKNEDGTYTRIA